MPTIKQEMDKLVARAEVLMLARQIASAPALPEDHPAFPWQLNLRTALRRMDEAERFA